MASEQYQSGPTAEIRLYENDLKEGDPGWTEKHPVSTGTGEFGKEFVRALVSRFKETGESEAKVRLAAWERVSKSGLSYLYVKVELARVRSAPPPPPPAPAPESDPVEDDLPF